MKRQSILELSSSEARQFFLKTESYCNFELPIYIQFGKLLCEIDKIFNNKNVSDFRIKDPRDYENLNHIILNNKDGKYAWRPMQLIHPALYVSLVHKITQEENWKIICRRFAEFFQDPKIECVSLPGKSLTNNKDKAEQILYWWEEVEQRSIEFALDYGCLIHTDITDCYPSIYTHSIAWALHGKTFAKENRKDRKLIGNIIDNHIQDFSHGQTNGIPQGSVLMDFIAEIVLGYADVELSKRIKEHSIDDYHIIRYRDDYRIFVNNPQDGEKILKLLTEGMIELGLKLNPSKTKLTNQVIRESIKSDKLYWIGQKQRENDLQKHLLIIHKLAAQFPNSGSLINALTSYRQRIFSKKNVKGHLLPLISIAVDIAYHNPKCYAISSAILNKFISLLKSDDQKRTVINRIRKRFNQIPNTGHLQIWLQRITLTFDKIYEYEEPICRIVTGETFKLWNNDWLSDNLKNLIQSNKIVDQAKIKKLPPVITAEEVALFTSHNWNS